MRKENLLLAYLPEKERERLSPYIREVSTEANMLQQAGLIRYSRGQLRILDADGLRNGSCECLELMEREFEKIFQ